MHLTIFLKPTQVMDFQVCLRAGVPADIIKQQLRLVLVLARLEAGHQMYVRANLLHLLHLHSIRTVAPPLYKLWWDQSSSFNEEEGEIFLSLLSQRSAGTATQSNPKTLCNLFVLLNSQRENSSLFAAASGRPDRKLRTRLIPSVREPQLLAELFEDLMASWRQNEYYILDIPARSAVGLKEEQVYKIHMHVIV